MTCIYCQLFPSVFAEDNCPLSSFTLDNSVVKTLFPNFDLDEFRNSRAMDRYKIITRLQHNFVGGKYTTKVNVSFVIVLSLDTVMKINLIISPNNKLCAFSLLQVEASCPNGKQIFARILKISKA